MRKFEKKINELGLEKGKLSKSLNDFVINFGLAEDELKSLRINLKQAQQEEDNDEEIDNLLAKIDEMENDLEEADNELVKKVIMHHKNGDLYAARAQKMRDAREAKAANKNNTPKEAKQVNTEEKIPQVNNTINQPITVESTTPQAKVETPQPTLEQPKPKEEKKGTNWILWGVLGVAGIFVGINLFKKNR
jgi:hypothetical protein